MYFDKNRLIFNIYFIYQKNKTLLTYNFSFFDDWDHVTGWEPHLIGGHEQLEGVLVHPHGGLILLHHLASLSYI